MDADMTTAARALVDALPPETAEAWGALPTTRGGTAREWFTARHGRTVDTLQATVEADGTLRNGWAPGPRTVDATRAGSVSLDGSARMYSGLRVDASSDTHLVASCAWGHTRQLCVYRVTDAN